jgi:hypothetical protein
MILGLLVKTKPYMLLTCGWTLVLILLRKCELRAVIFKEDKYEAEQTKSN